MARLFSSSHAAELVLILYDSVRLCLGCEALMGLHGLCVQLEGKHENTHLTFVYIRLLLNLYALVRFQIADLVLGLKTKRLILHQQGLSAFWVILQCLVSKDPFNVSMVFLHVHVSESPTAQLKKIYAYAHNMYFYCNTFYCSFLQIFLNNIL